MGDQGDAANGMAEQARDRPPDDGVRDAAEGGAEQPAGASAAAGERHRERVAEATDAARERLAEAAGNARDRVAEAHGAARERVADAAGSALGKVADAQREARRRLDKRPDVPWARKLPARFVRSMVQHGLLLPVLNFISPVAVVGKRNLRRINGPVVFIANHQSHFDAPVCLAAVGRRIRRRLVIAAAADYFYKSGVVGMATSIALGTVPFHRSGGLSRSSLELLKDLVGEGWSVLIFPSGSRGSSSISGFKRGFAFLAVDKQVPVVPLYLHGLEHVLPKGSSIPLPGGVAVGVGQPIPPGEDYDDLVKRAEVAMADVQAMVRRWEAA
jgi:1-acyl-sn-glycerol-3-phosphate acyltransferase